MRALVETLTVALALTSALASGCQMVGGFEDFQAASGGNAGTGGSGGGSGDAASDVEEAGSACPAGTDPGKHGPSMAQVKRTDGTCFWIDTTEVTFGQYGEFLTAAGVSPPVQDAVCAGNAPTDAGGAAGSPGFAPEANCVASLNQGELRPVSCVDWCDALAFCTWAGKELCADVSSGVSSGATSDWVQACTAGDDGVLYGCGAGCQTSACNGEDPSGDAVDVGTTSQCFERANDGATKLWDLSGNVSEWTAGCKDTSATSNCAVRGGSFASSAAQLACTGLQTTPRTATQPTIGFRCCAAAHGDAG